MVQQAAYRSGPLRSRYEECLEWKVRIMGESPARHYLPEQNEAAAAPLAPEDTPEQMGEKTRKISLKCCGI